MWPQRRFAKFWGFFGTFCKDFWRRCPVFKSQRTEEMTMGLAMGRIAGTGSVMVCVALLLGSCESSPRLPTAPDPPSAPAPPAGRTHTLSGVVTTGGAPVVGARVAVLEIQPERSATTDGNGSYSISGVETSSFWDRTLVRFSQPGSSLISSGRIFGRIRSLTSCFIR